MVNLTDLELQNLKHLIGGHDTMAQKLEQYAQIAQTENMDLRNTIEQIRNKDEESQFELYTIAKNKKFHQPAPKVTQEDIDRVKQGLQV